MSARTQGNLGAWAAAGATLSAILSSACCWLPLLLLAFGASTSGLSASFEAYRTPLLLVTALLLAMGFYLVYFRKPSCGPGGLCSVPSSKLTRLNKGMLWVAAFLVAAFAFFPSYVGALLGERLSASADGTVIQLDVQGMTCEACAVHVEKGLRSVPGVLAAAVSYDERRAAVTLDRTSPPGEAELVRAVGRAGYKAAMTQGPAEATANQPEPRGAR